MVSRRTWRLGAVVLVAVIVCVFGWILFADAAPPYDDDLQPAALPELEHDALRQYLQAPKVLSLAPGSRLPSIDQYWADSDPILLAWASANRAAVKLVTDAVTTGFRLPECLRPSDPIPSLLDAHNLAMLLVIEGDRLQNEGRTRDAMAARLVAVRLGTIFSDGNAVTMSACIGMSMRLTSLRAIVHALGDLDADGLRWLRSELRSLRVTDQMVSEIVKREYRLSALLCDERKSYAGIDPVFFKPNQTKRLLSAFHRELLADIERPPGERRTHKLVERATTASTLGRWVRANPQGEAYAFCVPAAFLSKIDELRYWDDATDHLIAIRLFELRTGRRPERLSELVPRELQVVGRDPFDGQPLRYDSSEGLISSPFRSDAWFRLPQ